MSLSKALLFSFAGKTSTVMKTKTLFKEVLIMAGYVLGSKLWYEHAKDRLIEISEKLKSSDIKEDERERLYSEQYELMYQLENYAE